MAAGPAQIPAIAAQTSSAARPAGKPSQRGTRQGDVAGAGALSGLKNANWSEMVIPIAVLAIVLAMITPLPSFVLDVLISTNLTMSVIVLLVAMYITKPADFSIFPTTLLLMTLFRLALNISSARLILLNGNSGTSAAGEVIQAFGAFVVGGNYIIGVVIFLVLIAIQYVVINHGAVRISEVTARFTLDALPGKQMSIDSDLNGGLIDESEARSRRKQLVAEAEFYGAMDGASRFTQRDAVASILITGINIIAGFLIGVLQHNMELRRAIETYTVLTIGDGLVTVIPALMISISGGLIVTRTSSDSKLGADVRAQIFANPQPILLAAGVLIAMAAFPGLPKIPFLLLGAGAGAIGWKLRKSAAAREARPAPVAPAARDNVETLLKVEPLAVEVGLGLIHLVEGGQNSPLLRRIGSIRRQLASELGYILPPVRVADNLSLRAREYAISIKGVEVARFELPQGVELAISPGEGAAPVNGMPTREPAFGIAAFWVTPDNAEAARRAGYTVVDATSVVGTHLGEVIRRHAHELLSRQDAKRFLDRVAEENPKAIEELVPKLLPLVAVHKVLQNLLRERVSIRDSLSIVEALGEAAGITRNTVLLTEYVRQSIRRLLVKPQLNPQGDLAAWIVDSPLEQAVESSVEHGETSSHLSMSPQRIRDVLDRVAGQTGPPENPAVLLASSGSRYFLRQITEASLPNLTVFSHGEIPAGVKVMAVGTIR
jgi:flagellar biosynthesis protein FlhA